MHLNTLKHTKCCKNEQTGIRIFVASYNKGCDTTQTQVDNFLGKIIDLYAVPLADIMLKSVLVAICHIEVYSWLE